MSLAIAAACELANISIRVNAASPALIDQPSDAWAEWVQRWLQTEPLDRLGTQEDVADACLLLASPLASWITGHNLVVDSGISAVSAY